MRAQRSSGESLYFQGTQGLEKLYWKRGGFNMMEPINFNNYQAWLLDYAEGNLSAAQRQEVEQFLENNPPLREELEGFENIPIVPTERNKGQWGDLKKPGLTQLQDSESARGRFFAYAIDGKLNKIEQNILARLCEDPAFKKEYQEWKALTLQADNLKLEKDGLFKFGHETELSAFTYEHYLIALGEGLLNPAQEKRLELYASRKKNGANDLALAKNLKLKPAPGIFYPDKSNLFKKEKSTTTAWFLRVAAIFVLLLSGWFVINLTNTPESRYAQRDASGIDRTMTTITPKKAAELAVRNYSAAIEKPSGKAADSRFYSSGMDANLKENAARSVKGQPELLMARNAPAIGVSKEPALAINSGYYAENSAKGNKQQARSAPYKTLPQLAENYLARKIPQAQKKSLNLADQLVKETGQLLDVELEASTKSPGQKDKSKTYLLRIGSFKIEHISAN
jgi:hypothetical protein